MDEDETVEAQVEGLVDKVVAEDEARRAEELVRPPLIPFDWPDCTLLGPACGPITKS